MSSQSKKTASDSGASESESESEEEETKNRITVKQQEAPKQEQKEEDEEDEEEEEEESETDSDDEADARYDTVKRDVYAGAPAKVSAAEYPVGKRGRDLNGGKGTTVEEPANKKRKEAKDEKARVQPVKPASPVKGVKGLRTTAFPKADRARAVPIGKGENAKPQAASRKRKASPPPVNSSRQQLRKGDVERSSPLKAKKTAHWSGTLEQSLTQLLYKDKCNGFPIPVSRGDAYWEKLLKRLPLEVEMTELQVVDKVKRMRNRYHTLEKKFKEEGGKGEGGKTHFKNAHEEKLFHIWEGIWGPATEPAMGRAVTSQPATDEEDSEDESEGTASPPGETRVIRGQLKREESSSEDENEEEEEDVRRKAAGLNVMNAAGKPRAEQIVVTPFVSKPRLEFTPLIPKDDKRKVSKKSEEVTSGDQHTGDVLAGDDGRKGDVNFLTTEHLKQLKAETLTFFQEIRGNCFQLVEEIRGDRFGNLAGGLGNFAFGKGIGNPGMLDGVVTGSGSQAALQLQKKWREHKVQELALLSERLQLLQEQCRLQQDELKLHNQKLDQQERSK